MSKILLKKTVERSAKLRHSYSHPVGNRIARLQGMCLITHMRYGIQYAPADEIVSENLHIKKTKFIKLSFLDLQIFKQYIFRM